MEQQANVQLPTIIQQVPEDHERTFEGTHEMKRLYKAVFFGNHGVAKYLFKEHTRLRDDGWNATNLALLLQKCVEGDMFDIALKIVKEYPELASSWENLLALARKPDAFVEKSSNLFSKTVNCFSAFVFRTKGHPKKDSETLELLKIILEDIAKKPFAEIVDEIKKWDILFIAAERGNTKFIVELISRYPQLKQMVNNDKQNIFHIAVIHHRRGIYNLLYQKDDDIDEMTEDVLQDPFLIKDVNGNNLFHLAGKSTIMTRYQDASGVAFQMLDAQAWFREVESKTPPSRRESKNNDNLTAYQLFDEEHREPNAKGEKWIKGAASHCMMVAALIDPAVFAVAFTVPGGYNQTNGIPIFRSQATFMLFLVADAISLFSSAASILMFLSILASRYAERYSLQSLTKKLMLGIATLFLSITTMIITFSVSSFVLYSDHLGWMPILICLFGVVPVFLFVWLICPLIADVYRSTYGSTYLFRPKKHVLSYENLEMAMPTS